MTLPLIDKQDSFELVRDQIAGVLLAELARQQVLALAASEDPLDWTLAVYIERNFPHEKWLNADGAVNASTVPTVSIWAETSVFDPSRSSGSASQQIYEVTYNLDILARGVNTDVAGGGFVPADKDARLRCHAATRLVRNILSASENRNLGLTGIVWPYPQFENFEFGPVQLDDTEAAIQAWNCRARFRVRMTEMSPEEALSDNIELIHVEVSDTDEVILVTETT